MGFFDFFKKGSDTVGSRKASSIIPWLESVDDLYNKALQTKLVGDLDKYLTDACMRKVSERLWNSDAEIIGLARYRKTVWCKENDNLYIKKVSYEDMKLSKTACLAFGDPYVEYWTITTTEAGENKVSEIRRVEC